MWQMWGPGLPYSEVKVQLRNLAVIYGKLLVIPPRIGPIAVSGRVFDGLFN